MNFFIDLSILASLIIAITAFNGVILNTIGERIIGRKNRTKFVDQTNATMTGWSSVGGKGKHRKQMY
ncbi:MAG: hypothetical protein ACRCWQ_05130 [Bacilli bacterium]